MTKTVRPRYTLVFKQEAVRPVTGGQKIAAAARSLGAVEQTLCHNGLPATALQTSTVPF